MTFARAIWCPKYRRKVLIEEVKKRLRELLNGKASEIGVSIEIEIMPDHLHLFIKPSPTASARVRSSSWGSQRSTSI